MTDLPGEPLERLDRAGVRDLVAKGWLTHDGMWFGQAARSLGVEVANHLNRAAIRAMARFEVSRLSAALGDPRAGAGVGIVTSHCAGPTFDNWPRRLRNGFANIGRMVAGRDPEWLVP